MTIAVPRQIKARSRTGKPKAAHVFKLLQIKGYVPFAVSDAAYHQERVRHADGTWTDVRLTTNLRGTPITRAVVDGELMDVTWYHGPVSDAACTRCTIANGEARPIVRSTRTAKVKAGHDRVPVLHPDVLRGEQAEYWHLACLRLRLAQYGRNGHDVRQTATRVAVSK